MADDHANKPTLIGRVIKHAQTKSSSVRDIVVIALVSIVVFALSAAFDVFDKVISWVYRHETWQLDELFTVSVFLVFAFTVYAWRRHRELTEEIRHRQAAEAEKALLIPELESARADVHILKKLLPMCSLCRRVRDDEGYWDQVEAYVEHHLSTRFDAGTCPECARKLYGRETAPGSHNT